MSVICSNDVGFVLSHENFINKIYGTSINNAMRAKSEMFAINTPYKTNEQASACSGIAEQNNMTTGKKRKKPKKANQLELENKYSSLLSEAKIIQQFYPSLVEEAQKQDYFLYIPTRDAIAENNIESRIFASKVFQESTLKGNLSTFHGGNTSSQSIVASINDQSYILPPNCSFFCQDISTLDQETLGNADDTFSLIIVDPPWRNKYIRRRKACNQESGYSMLSTDDLAQIKLQPVLAPGALVAVWCTNCQGHINNLKDKIFPAWGLTYIATWFWLKVDRSGSPVCDFSVPPGKQPYERIIFGRQESGTYEKDIALPKENFIIISIPSAIHSHKPPLLDVLKPFVGPSPKTLEIFARSLLPDTVSWGLEVLKLQHEYLFTEDIKSPT